MKRPFREPLLTRAALCATALLSLAATSAATTFAKMSIQNLAHAATVIARVRCVSNTTVRDAGEIWTLTTFDVEQSWRGSLSEQLTVRMLGGRTAQITSSVSGIPRFRSGEEAVLFLEPEPRGGFRVVGWQQGMFRIRRDARTGGEIAVQDTGSVPIFDPATRQFETPRVNGLALAELRAQADAAATRAGVGQR